MADNNKAKNLYTGDPRAEKKYYLRTYYRVAGGYTVIAAVLNIVRYVLEKQGYALINTSIRVWLGFALAIGIILVVGRLVNDLPKSKDVQRTVKICVAIMSILTLFAMYFFALKTIETSPYKWKEYSSPDGKHTVIVMRQDVYPMVDVNGTIAVNGEATNMIADDEKATAQPEGSVENEDGKEAEVTAIAKEETNNQSVTTAEITIYSAYVKLNGWFYDTNTTGRQIWMKNDPNTEPEGKWIGNEFVLTTEGNVFEIPQNDMMEKLNEIKLEF